MAADQDAVDGGPGDTRVTAALSSKTSRRGPQLRCAASRSQITASISALTG